MLPRKYKYLEWYKVEPKFLSKQEIDAKITELIAEGGVDVTTSKTKASDWIYNKISYHLDKNKSGSSYTLYVYKDYRMQIYRRSSDDESFPITSGQCGKELRDVYRSHTGVSLQKAYGVVSSEEYRACCPKPLYYINRKYANKTISNVSGIDVTSMFPAKICGKLPDAHTAIKLQGKHKPTEEYQFAFYLKSHHCAEYGVFDTHDYMSPALDMTLALFLCSDIKKRVCIYEAVKDDDEITVLMKPSKYVFDQAIEQIADRKAKGDKLAKAVMNIGIGTLHRNPENQFGSRKGKAINSYYHICAIMQGRANKLQLDTMKEIKKKGGIVLQAIVDSLIYIDNNIVIGTREKKFGEYHIEFTNAEFRMANVLNRYAVAQDGKIIKKRLSGNFDISKIVVLEDIDQFNEVKDNGKRKKENSLYC